MVAGEEGDGDDGKSSVQKEVEEGVTVLLEKTYGLYVQVGGWVGWVMGVEWK